MPVIPITTRQGGTRAIDAAARLAAMEDIRKAGIAEMIAPGGGCASCAPCHVHVDAAMPADAAIPPRPVATHSEPSIQEISA